MRVSVSVTVSSSISSSVSSSLARHVMTLPAPEGRVSPPTSCEFCLRDAETVFLADLSRIRERLPDWYRTNLRSLFVDLFRRGIPRPFVALRDGTVTFSIRDPLTQDYYGLDWERIGFFVVSMLECYDLDAGLGERMLGGLLDYLENDACILHWGCVAELSPADVLNAYVRKRAEEGDDSRSGPHTRSQNRWCVGMLKTCRWMDCLLSSTPPTPDETRSSANPDGPRDEGASVTNGDAEASNGDDDSLSSGGTRNSTADDPNWTVSGRTR